MDPLSAVTTVVGLVPVCFQAFEMVETACRAKEDAQKQYQRILMQKGVRHFSSTSQIVDILSCDRAS
jgi:hypothetical protein